ncbi:hypothetical protein [Clostridium oryzae]|uniref:Uncharacterized protein n=1 Tax=Clostridium oryzae TaxID=1450648 RepID=A0A1V4IH14_9CLOT|nr:hypothetical protein [Clostridium oryzae]OPJ59282.1 hypothetical protein CLORY_33680 [Clostridium oryzae]
MGGKNLNLSIKHPSKDIMRELIKDQWTKDSIFAAIIDSKGNIVSKGKTTIGDEHILTAIDEIKDYFK